MIKLQSTSLAPKWVAVIGITALIGIGAFQLLKGTDAVADGATSAGDAFGALVQQGATPHDRSAPQAAQATVPDANNGTEAHGSTALDTGMEDWKKPENVALRAELQRWYDHREELSLAQRQADASALMAKVEAQQAAGKINPTSAALAKLMILQGAPSDDPKHAAQLQQVMALLAGQLSFGE